MADGQTPSTNSPTAESKPMDSKPTPQSNAQSPTESDGGADGGNGGGGWSWGSWISSAKNKSASVLEAVKKDLDELSSAVKTEVSNAGAAFDRTLQMNDSSSAVGTVKKSLSEFFEQVTEALIPSVEDDESEAILITSDGAVTLTGFQKHLADLQANEATYLEGPGDVLTEKYQRWMEVVEQDQFTQNRLARHLVASEILNEKYVSLVPDKVTHMEFWQRYLFKRALLEDALANADKAEKKAMAEVASTKTVTPKKALIQTEQPKRAVSDEDLKDTAQEAAENLVVDDDIKWEAEDFGHDVEISEEEQARLLAEYEQEIQEREKRSVEEKPVDTNKSSSKQKKQPIAQKTQQAKSAAAKSANNQKVPAQKSAKSQKSQQPATTAATAKKSTDKTVTPKQKPADSGKEPDSASNSDGSWEKEFELDE